MKSDIKKKIGNRIRLMREKKGMTQEQLALKVGYDSRSTICCIETGSRGVPIDKIIEIAKCLDCTPEYLTFGKEE